MLLPQNINPFQSLKSKTLVSIANSKYLSLSSFELLVEDYIIEYRIILHYRLRYNIFIIHISLYDVNEIDLLTLYMFSIFYIICCRYYPLEVSYFKSSLDSHLLDLLWNKYWVNTLSSNALLTVSVFPTYSSLETIPFFKKREGIRIILIHLFSILLYISIYISLYK